MKKLLLLPTALLFFACNDGTNQQQDDTLAANQQNSASGTFTRSYSGNTFNAIDIDPPVNVSLTQSERYSVRLEGDEEFIKELNVEVRGRTLHIEHKRKNLINNNQELNVYISAPEFHDIDLSGAAQLSATNRISGNYSMDIDLSGASNVDLALSVPSLKMDCSGATDANLDLTVTKLAIDCSGAGVLEIKGTTEELVFEGSGATSLDAKELQATRVKVDVSGTGSAEVWATTELDADVSGTSSVRYKGSPTNIKSDKSGLASIEAIH